MTAFDFSHPFSLEKQDVFSSPVVGAAMERIMNPTIDMPPRIPAGLDRTVATGSGVDLLPETSGPLVTGSRAIYSWAPETTKGSGGPEPLDAVIISDLHLGSQNCQAKLLNQFLESLLERTDSIAKLIIVGDVFDSIDFRRLKKTHWKVLSNIRHLSDKMEVIWLAGNHDGSADIVSHLLGVTVLDEYVLASGQRKILILHGHVFDEFIDDHPILTWLADMFYHMLQRIDKTHRVARLAKKRSKTFLHCLEKIEKGATGLAKKLGCTAAVCGHTHAAVAKNAHETGTEGVEYYNSGCWTELPPHYLTVKDGVVSLHTYMLPEEAGVTEVGEPAVAAV